MLLKYVHKLIIVKGYGTVKCSRSTNSLLWSYEMQVPIYIWDYITSFGVGHALASFPGSHVWAEKKEPGTHCLCMLSSPRISGNLEISVKYAPLH